MFFIETLGFTVSTLGKILIGVSAFNVHRHIAKAHRIDNVVLADMRREKMLAILGIVLMIVGYFMELPFKG